MKLKVLTLLATALFSLSSNANLLVNGSFESPDVKDNSWSYFTDDNQVDGWSFGESSMEIWDTPFLGIDAYDGEQIAELNAHGANSQAYGFYQSFNTVIGQSYNYSFAYIARGNGAQSFTAGIQDDTPNTLTSNTFVNNIGDYNASTWSLFNGSFIATSSLSSIFFLSNDNLGDTTGNLLDAVSVTAVPEPGSIMLLGLGLAGLIISRKRNS